jgi:hypothetical protein
MSVQAFARLIGWLYVGVAILGFIPGAVQPGPTTPEPASATSAYGYLLGLFPVNLLHNLVHLGVGIWGLAAAHGRLSAIGFARGLAVFYGALAVMGLIPALDTMFGLVPLYGHDIWLHAGTAAIAAYFGWGMVARQATIAESWRKAS